MSCLVFLTIRLVFLWGYMLSQWVMYEGLELRSWLVWLLTEQRIFLWVLVWFRCSYFKVWLNHLLFFPPTHKPKNKLSLCSVRGIALSKSSLELQYPRGKEKMHLGWTVGLCLLSAPTPAMLCELAWCDDSTPSHTVAATFLLCSSDGVEAQCRENKIYN